jgi:membrane protein YdbS with pleckstrin-like domain
MQTVYANGGIGMLLEGDSDVMFTRQEVLEMDSSVSSTDPSEPDLYWSGHSGWAMLPGLVVGTVISAAVMLAVPLLGEWISLPEQWTAFALFWLVLGAWLAAGLVWAYRAASYVYRLTPLSVHTDFGMLFRPFPPVPLLRIVSIESRAGALRRLFGVGSVVVQSDDRAALHLKGIFRPDLFANALRTAVARARQA